MLIYDSIDPFAIPTNVEAVAGYVDGLYGPIHASFRLPGWDATGWARFPNARHIGIAVSAATNAGDALDVENGDAAPSEAPAWVRMRRAAGVARPWVYCNRGNRTAVEAALQADGIQPTEVAMWIATLDGTQTVPPRLYPVAAVQYANSTIAGGHYDISIMNQAFAQSEASLEDEMRVWIRNPATGEIAIWGPTGKRHVTPDEWGLFGSQPPNGYGDMPRDINQIQWDAIPNAPAQSSTPATEPAEPAEPAEPTKITGTFTGTLA